MKQRHHSQDPVWSWSLQLLELMTLADDVVVREHDLMSIVNLCSASTSFNTHSLGQSRRPATEVQIPANLLIRLSLRYPIWRVGRIFLPLLHELLKAQKALGSPLKQEDLLTWNASISRRGQSHLERSRQRNQDFRLRNLQRIGHFLNVIRRRRAVNTSTCATQVSPSNPFISPKSRRGFTYQPE